MEREKKLGLDFPIHGASATQPTDPNADPAAQIRKRSPTRPPAIRPTTIKPQHRSMTMRRWFSMKKTDDTTGEILIYDKIGRSSGARIRSRRRTSTPN
ncbi:hypothetical protein [Bradyrhizobium sp. USDA 3256]